MPRDRISSIEPQRLLQSCRTLPSCLLGVVARCDAWPNASLTVSKVTGALFHTLFHSLSLGTLSICPGTLWCNNRGAPLCSLYTLQQHLVLSPSLNLRFCCKAFYWPSVPPFLFGFEARAWLSAAKPLMSRAPMQFFHSLDCLLSPLWLFMTLTTMLRIFAQHELYLSVLHLFILCFTLSWVAHACIVLHPSQDLYIPLDSEILREKHKILSIYFVSWSCLTSESHHLSQLLEATSVSCQCPVPHCFESISFATGSIRRSHLRCQIVKGFFRVPVPYSCCPS